MLAFVVFETQSHYADQAGTLALILLPPPAPLSTWIAGLNDHPWLVLTFFNFILLDLFYFLKCAVFFLCQCVHHIYAYGWL